MLKRYGNVCRYATRTLCKACVGLKDGILELKLLWGRLCEIRH